MIFSDINVKFDKLLEIKKKKLKLLQQEEKYQLENKSTKRIKNGKTLKEEGFKESLLDKLLKAGVMLGALKVAEFVADRKNIDAVAGILRAAKTLFDIALNVADFGAGNLMDGLSKVAGDKTILAKFVGGIQAAIGFISLRWLINPTKILGDIKSLPKLLGKFNNALKFFNLSVAGLGNFAKLFAKDVFKGIDKFFSRAIMKVFGKPIWIFLRKLVNGVYASAGKLSGNLLGKATAGVGKLASRFIPKALVKAGAAFLTKIPIVGSLLGFGINLILGDPVEKAAFKLGTATAGTALGGAVGLAFPPAVPFTAAIGGFLGDWLGDTLYDKFVPPKLALGGVVSHISKEGTHVIVAEEEDEVVIPLSMFKMDDAIGGKLFEPIKIVASNILGSIKSVIGNNGAIYANISSDITASLVPLINTFGSTTVVSKSITAGYINSGSNEVIKNQSTSTNTDVFGKSSISKVSKTDIISSTNNTSVRGLLRSILDVIVNSNAVGEKSMNISPGGTPPPAIVQSISSNTPSADVPGTVLGVGRATYYDPNDPRDKTSGGHKLSTGGRYDSSTMNGAAFPDLILRLPKRYTTSTSERPQYFKGKTIKKPFMVKIVQRKTGKQAYVQINDVGIGEMGDHTRLVDMSAKTKEYFGGDSREMEIQLAPDNVQPGALPDLKKMAGGGEYVYNEFPHKRWAGARRGRKHAGEDIAMRPDSTFQSFIGGKVMYKGFQPGKNLYGHYIDIYNDRLKVTERIAEAGKFYVQPGDMVNPGQMVSTGTSTGMIHYEVRPASTYTAPQFGFSGTIDPVKYLQSIGALTVGNNTIKNNGLQSLLSGTTLVADMGGSSGDASPPPPSNSPGTMIAAAPVPIPIDYGKIGSAFTTLTQMLEINGVDKRTTSPSTNMRTIGNDKKIINNINVIRSGNTANVIAVEQKILPPTKTMDMRLRRI